MLLRAACLFFLGLAGSASAQEAASDPASSQTGGNAGMGALVSQGYEIRAAVRQGDRTIVFLQKDKSAYACDFVTLTKSRCGSIN